MSLAFRSLKLHSQSVHRKRITFPSSLHTWDRTQLSFLPANHEALEDVGQQDSQDVEPPQGTSRGVSSQRSGFERLESVYDLSLHPLNPTPG